MRVVFMGSPDFSVPSLRALREHGFEVPLVVCQPDKPAGRGRHIAVCPIKQSAEELGLPVACPPRIKGKRGAPFLQQVEEIAPDFIVVAAYGKILPRRLLGIPRIAPINVHASLLPRWRGASPIQHAILSGDSETGVAIMQMEEGLDEGGVYSAVREPIRPDDTGGSLSQRLADLGATALCDALPRIAAGSLRAEPQPEHGVTFAPLLKKEDGWLDFGRPAQELERRVRALDPWPCTYTTLRGAMLKVMQVVAEPADPGYADAAPATVIEASADLVVRCGEGVLRIKELQLAGKRRMQAREFLPGARLAPGAQLGV